MQILKARISRSDQHILMLLRRQLSYIQILLDKGFRQERNAINRTSRCEVDFHSITLSSPQREPFLIGSNHIGYLGAGIGNALPS